MLHSHWYNFIVHIHIPPPFFKKIFLPNPNVLQTAKLSEYSHGRQRKDRLLNGHPLEELFGRQLNGVG